MTPRQALFIREYLVDLNATQAAIRAGYKAHSAEVHASRLLSKANIRRAVDTAMARRAARTDITADRVLMKLWAIANADPNELIEHRVGCCRYCWGEGNKYQRTRGEMERDRIKWINSKEENKPDFDVMGGVGYHKRKPPNPECQECFGDGVGEVVVKDTRKLSPEAQALYAGVKQTKDGIEVKMKDQDAALLSTAKHIGFFKEYLELTGKDGGPVEYAKFSDAELSKRIAEVEHRIREATGRAGQPPGISDRSPEG